MTSDLAQITITIKGVPIKVHAEPIGTHEEIKGAWVNLVLTLPDGQKYGVGGAFFEEDGTLDRMYQYFDESGYYMDEGGDIEKLVAALGLRPGAVPKTFAAIQKAAAPIIQAVAAKIAAAHHAK